MLTAALNVFTLARDPDLAARFVAYVPKTHRDDWRAMVKAMKLPPREDSALVGPKPRRGSGGEDPPAKRGCGGGGKPYPVLGKVNGPPHPHLNPN